MATKIFLSSVSRGLEETRQQVADYIKRLGHETIFFESDTFTKTQFPTMLQTCLSNVEDCHVFVLIIGEEVGTYLDQYEKSVTHLELRKAISANKTIIVFVDSYLRDSYFREFRRIFRDEHKRTGKKPMFSEVADKIQVLSIKREVLDILNDAYQVVPWIFSYKTAGDINAVIKNELSSMLESYIVFKNNKQIDSFEKLLYARRRYEQFDRFVSDIQPLIKKIETDNLNDVLKRVQSNLKGGMVYINEGAEIITKMVEVGNCEGTSLYHFDGDHTLVLKAKSGLAGGHQICDLSDPESFVATTYRNYIEGIKQLDEELNDDIEESEFNEEQQQFFNAVPQVFRVDDLIYICHVFERYVFTVHFRIEELFVDWGELNLRTNDLFSGIMKLKANNDIISMFSLFLLGGEVENNETT